MTSGQATMARRVSFPPYDIPRVAVLRSDCSVKALGRALEEKGASVLDLPLGSRVSGDLWRFQPDTIVTGLCSEAPYRVLNLLRELDPDQVDATLVLLLVPELRVEMLAPYFEAGVDDVISPPHSAASVLLRRWIHLRTASAPNVMPDTGRAIRLGTLQIDIARRQVAGGESELELSGREFELLLELYEAGGTVVSRDALLAGIWGQTEGSEAVLDATVHRLRRKLDRAGSEGDRVATVRGIGYQLDLEPDSRAAS